MHLGISRYAAQKPLQEGNVFAPLAAQNVTAGNPNYALLGMMVEIRIELVAMLAFQRRCIW